MNRKIMVLSIIFSLLINLIPVSFPAFASEGVTVEIIKDPVQYKKSLDSKWEEVSGKINLATGQYINVGPGGAALVNFPDGSIVRLYENSMLRIYEIIDTGKTRNYTIRFLGKIVASPAKNDETGSNFNSNSPTTDIFSNGIEYTAEVETDMFVRVNIINGDARAKESYKLEGKVKEISLADNYFLLEISKDKIIKVKTYPHTIFFEKYKNYQKTGNPQDLGHLTDIAKGQTVTVYGEFDPKGRYFGIVDPDNMILHATLITDKCLLPAAAFAVWGTPPVMGAGITAGVVLGVIGVVVIGVGAGGGQDVSRIRP